MRPVVRMFLGLVLVSSLSLNAQDAAARLARILAEKGMLTGAELDAVMRAEAGESVRLLAELLHRKGILTPSDMARLDGGDRDGAAVIAVSAAQPARPQEPPPATSAARFPLQFYGTVLWNAAYNTSGVNNEDIPLLASKRGADPFASFGMTVRQSRFGLRYQGPSVAGAKLGGAVELDLFGGKAALTNGVSMDIFRIRLAYGRLDWKNVSLEAGQDWSVFSPLNPTSLAAYAIPALSTSGNPWIRTPQFRVELRSDATSRARLLWQTAVLDPNVGDYPSEFRTLRQPGIGERGRGPALESRLALLTKIDDRDASVGLSAHYNHGKNAGMLQGRSVERDVNAWGVNLDFTAPVHRKFGLQGEAFAGRALGVFSVASGLTVLPPGTPGERGAGARGGWFQAQFNPHPKWQVNAGYGIESLDAAHLRLGDRVRNQTYLANLMYKLSPHITWAWEWRRFLTGYRSQPAADAASDHANMAIGYTF